MLNLSVELIILILYFLVLGWVSSLLNFIICSFSRAGCCVWCIQQPEPNCFSFFCCKLLGFCWFSFISSCFVPGFFLLCVRNCYLFSSFGNNRMIPSSRENVRFASARAWDTQGCWGHLNLDLVTTLWSRAAASHSALRYIALGSNLKRGHIQVICPHDSGGWFRCLSADLPELSWPFLGRKDPSIFVFPLLLLALPLKHIFNILCRFFSLSSAAGPSDTAQHYS